MDITAATVDNAGMRSPYQILSVSRAATDAEIKARYRALMKRHHPDHGGSEEKCKEVQGAYAQIKDAEARKAYDAERDGRQEQERRMRAEKAEAPRPAQGGVQANRPTTLDPGRLFDGLAGLGVVLAAGMIDKQLPDDPQVRQAFEQAREKGRRSAAGFMNLIREVLDIPNL